uniref:MRN complex interacting protein n=1 Tax=Homo sapiens TaxID=9606 RepID=E5RIC8_HUMAN
MASLQRSRVLRCCSCRLFQAHQVKKSVKWTCKACGEKQSFLQEKQPGWPRLTRMPTSGPVNWDWVSEERGWLTRLMVKALVLIVDAMSKS